MEALVYFILWAGMIFVLMRLACGAYVMGLGNLRNHSETETDTNSAGVNRWHPPERVKDPVCGRRVVTRDAKTSVFEGEVYFFCSRDCREIFEAAAELYVNEPPSHPDGPKEQPRV